MWLWGGMLYIWIISLIFYRYTFFRFSARRPHPALLDQHGRDGDLDAGRLAADREQRPTRPFLHSLRPFLEGFTVFYWATGTWWIPMHRDPRGLGHGYRRLPLEYDPLYWGAVFPLGMYAVATYRMAEAMDLDFLDAVPPVFLASPWSTWLVAFVGLLHRLWGGLVRRG